MAGATNKAMKAAGLPAKSIETVRVARGSGLSVQSAIQHAQAHGLPMGKAKGGELTGWQRAAAGVKTAPQERSAASRMLDAAAQVRAAGKPEAGHVLVNRGGQVTSEKEVHSRGPFSVHREGDGFAITHKPTGMAMARTKSEATARDIVNGIGDRGERLSDRMMGGDERASRVLARYVQAQGSKGKRLAAAHMAKALESAKDRRAQLVRQNEETARSNAANRKAAEEYWKPAAQRSAPATPKASPFTVAQPPAARATVPSRAPTAPASRATYQRGEAGANAAVAAMRKDIRAKVDEVRTLESHVANLHRYRAKLHAQRKPKQEQMVRESVKEFEPKLAAKRRELSAALAARDRVATSRAAKSRLERAGQGSLF